MLVLTRKANQKIEIGGNIVVTVLSVKGNSVRLGIEAPRDVRVVRGELGRKPESTPAELPAAAELVLPDVALPEASQPGRVRGASSSLRQAPLDAGRLRDLRCSPLSRFLAASAATDVAAEWPARETASAGETRLRV